MFDCNPARGGQTSQLAVLNVPVCRHHPVLRCVVASRYIERHRTVQKSNTAVSGTTSTTAKRCSRVGLEILLFLLESMGAIELDDASIVRIIESLTADDFSVLFADFTGYVKRHGHSERFYLCYLLLLHAYLDAIAIPLLANMDSRDGGNVAVVFLKQLLFSCPEFKRVRVHSNLTIVAGVVWVKLERFFSRTMHRLHLEMPNSATNLGHAGADFIDTRDDLLSFLSSLCKDLKMYYLDSTPYPSFHHLRSKVLEPVRVSFEGRLNERGFLENVFGCLRSNREAGAPLSTPNVLFKLATVHKIPMETVLTLFPYWKVQQIVQGAKVLCQSTLATDPDIGADGFLELLECVVKYSPFRDLGREAKINLICECIKLACIFDICSTDALFQKLSLAREHSERFPCTTCDEWECFGGAVSVVLWGMANNVVLDFDWGDMDILDRILDSLDNSLGEQFCSFLRNGLYESFATLWNNKKLDNLAVPVAACNCFRSKRLRTTSKAKDEPALAKDDANHNADAFQGPAQDNIPTGEQLLEIYSSGSASKAKIFYSTLSLGEGRSAQGLLREMAKKTSPNRVDAIRLLNQFLIWGVNGAGVLKARFVEMSVEDVLYAAQRERLAEFLDDFLHDAIPNMQNFTEALFRAALESQHLNVLKDICGAFANYDHFLAKDSLLTAARKILVRFGGTNGQMPLTQSRSVHQVAFALFRVFASLPDASDLFPRLFDRSVCEAVPCSSNSMSCLVVQGVIFLAERVKSNFFVSLKVLQARLVWIASHVPEVTRTHRWLKLWKLFSSSSKMDSWPSRQQFLTGENRFIWENSWASVFSAGYEASIYEGVRLSCTVPRRCSGVTGQELNIQHIHRAGAYHVAVPTICLFAYWEQENRGGGSDVARAENIWDSFVDKLEKTETVCAQELFVATVVALSKSMLGDEEQEVRAAPLSLYLLKCNFQKLEPTNRVMLLLEVLVAMNSELTVSTRAKFVNLNTFGKALSSVLRSLGGISPFLTQDILSRPSATCTTASSVASKLCSLFRKSKRDIFCQDNSLLQMLLQTIAKLDRLEISSSPRLGATTRKTCAYREFHKTLLNRGELWENVDRLCPQILKSELDENGFDDMKKTKQFFDLVLFDFKPKDSKTNGTTNPGGTSQQAQPTFDVYEDEPSSYSSRKIFKDKKSAKRKRKR
jgi:hypothetical protein